MLHPVAGAASITIEDAALLAGAASDTSRCCFPGRRCIAVKDVVTTTNLLAGAASLSRMRCFTSGHAASLAGAAPLSFVTIEDAASQPSFAGAAPLAGAASLAGALFH